uniref:Uncharacterized protein n=1 Tax=Amphora coffeiformis TaxID=265554 RepID=A0A7S3PB50_9STRA|mmetsp:Transcript_25521/g.48345  ORF Transcript_25521/g.48345 Transcript_25521/m.48345 type:complete len:124 (+) Transcript_25521:177-548(+)|eukprot:scaffold4442_cov125-Amphora_coffeaeformis.AAC.5
MVAQETRTTHHGALLDEALLHLIERSCSSGLVMIRSVVQKKYELEKETDRMMQEIEERMGLHTSELYQAKIQAERIKRLLQNGKLQNEIMLRLMDAELAADMDTESESDDEFFEFNSDDEDSS